MARTLRAGVRTSMTMRGESDVQAIDRAALRALIVEDDGDVARLLAGLLEETGFRTVDTVTTVGQAAAHLAAHPVDFAIVDFQLGGRTAAPIASDLLRRGIPFLFCTGRAGDAMPDEFAGQRMLRKPFTLEAFAAAVEATLARR